MIKFTADGQPVKGVVLIDLASPVNISGTITTGGTAQTLSAVKTTPRRFAIQNLSAGDLWINTKATAVAGSPSLRISSGAYYESPYATTNAISIIGATGGQAFTAEEW